MNNRTTGSHLIPLRRLLAAPVAARVVIAACFILASLPKIAAPADFAAAIRAYDLVPSSAVRPMAIILPWIELVAAWALLFSPRNREPAGGIILALLFAFEAALLITWARGMDLACGCFSPGPTPHTGLLVPIFRDLCLIILALAGFLSDAEWAGSSAQHG